MEFIEIKDLLHEYFRRDEDGNIEAIQPAVDHVNLKVKEGQFISILGHNGSGKSTLAKHINALLQPSSGTVIIDGMDITNPENTLPIRKQTGMVFQNPDNQIVAGIVEEDVAFGPENLCLESSEIQARVKESLLNMDMWEYRDKSPNRLSGGQKQRIAIAGILAMRPKTIILDEPTAMLDPDGRKDVINIAHELNKKYNMTIILITHYMEEAIGSDYVYVMENGNIILEGSDREIFAQANLLRKHRLNVPQITLIAEKLRKNGLNIPAGILTRQELVNVLKEIKNANDN